MVSWLLARHAQARRHLIGMISIENKGLLTVIGCCIAISWPGSLNFGFPGVMSPIWQEMFGVGKGAAGGVIFFMLSAVGIFMFLVGRWQERYGTRTMIAIGVIGCSLSVIVAGLATSMTEIYAWAFLTGMFSSFVYIPALTVVQRWYPQKRGLVSGIVSLVFGMSAAIMAPVFGHMLNIIGYTFMTFTVAALSLLTGLAALYIARSPDDLPDITVIKSKAPLGTEGKSQGESAQASCLPSAMNIQGCIRTRSFWILWTIWAIQGAAGVAMITLSMSYGLSKGMALESAVLILTAFNTTNGAGRVISGYLSDNIGRNLTMSVAFFGAGLAYFLLPHSSSLLTCSVLAAVIGFSFGTLFSVSAPLVSDCFGLQHFGAIFGLVFTAYGFFAGLLGPFLSGYVLDATGNNFSIVFMYLGFLCIISGAGIRLVVPPKPLDSCS